MKKVFTILLPGLVAYLPVLATALPALADECSYRATLSRVTKGTIRVPANAKCTLNGSTVKGNKDDQWRRLWPYRRSAWKRPGLLAGAFVDSVMPPIRTSGGKYVSSRLERRYPVPRPLARRS